METITVKDILSQRDRKPSVRQMRAVNTYLGANGGISKAEAIREAGYSESMATEPSRVFGSRAMVEMLKDKGVDENLGIEAVKRNVKAKIPTHFTFPSFRSPEEAKDVENGNVGDNFGEQMTDQQIREYLNGAGCIVTKIVHGEQARQVYGYTDNSKAQLAAANMIFNLLGSYAPKKVEGKHEHKVGVFSMSDLRKKMKEKGIKVTDSLPPGI